MVDRPPLLNGERFPNPRCLKAIYYVSSTHMCSFARHSLHSDPETPGRWEPGANCWGCVYRLDTRSIKDSTGQIPWGIRTRRGANANV